MTRWGFLRSKTFWGLSITGESIASLIAYDRWRLGQIREAHLAEARVMGDESSSEVEPLRKVTLITMASDPWALKKIRRAWREYAVELFTVAGCDYQLISIDAAKLNKELDRRLPVPDGQVPPEGKLPHEYFSADNWVRSTVPFWMQRLTGRANEETPRLSSWKNSPQDEDRLAYQLWTEQRPEATARDPSRDGIVALDAQTNTAVIQGVQDFVQAYGKPLVPSRIGYIPCDPSPSWLTSIYTVIATFSSASNRDLSSIFESLERPRKSVVLPCRYCGIRLKHYPMDTNPTILDKRSTARALHHSVVYQRTEYQYQYQYRYQY